MSCPGMVHFGGGENKLSRVPLLRQFERAAISISNTQHVIWLIGDLAIGVGR